MNKLDINTQKQPNPAEIYHSAQEILTSGIARVCHWPVSALDVNGFGVKIDDPKAKYFTISGAIMKSLMNHCGPENLQEKTIVYLEEIAKYIPEAHMHKYELPISIDLACLKKTDAEINSAFESVIQNIQEQSQIFLD
jgi:hypothetical protein